MKLGIISDIHDNIVNLKKAIEVLNNEQVKKVYFCGDLVSPFTLKWFKDFQEPIKAVFGNNEGDKVGIQRRINKYRLNLEYGPKQGLIFEDKIQSFNLAVFHGHSYEITTALVDSSKYNLLFTGHTHEPHIKKLKNKIWINPGSVTGFAEKVWNKPSMAIFDINTKKGKIVNL